MPQAAHFQRAPWRLVPLSLAPSNCALKPNTSHLLSGLLTSDSYLPLLSIVNRQSPAPLAPSSSSQTLLRYHALRLATFDRLRSAENLRDDLASPLRGQVNSPEQDFVVETHLLEGQHILGGPHLPIGHSRSCS